MKVLVIGGGGREHALVWKLNQSPLVKKLYCAPGNGGISRIAQCVPIGADKTDDLLQFSIKEKIDFVVVGPEIPLCAGIVDVFETHKIPVFGPSKAAARLEDSKIFAKEVMIKANVPTAFHKVFTSSEEAIEYLNRKSVPIVIKADGLAAGKGAIVADTREKAKGAVKLILDDRVFGSAGDRILVEEFLPGEEASMFALSDGKTVVPLLAAQDHKRVYDNDKGPNTGGMGAYCPAPVVDPVMQERVMRLIVEPVIQQMEKEGAPYKGVLFVGLMIADNEPKVLEFNVRFGDPETQAILPLLETDLMEVFLAVHEQKLDKIRLKWKQQTALTVVLASGGYPGEYEKGIAIQGLEALDDMNKVVAFHAGTSCKDGIFYTNGGRVLNITALGSTIENAQDRAYAAIKRIYFDKMHFRRDIGNKALQRLERVTNESAGK
ncbi:MAG: phosphoribosylamine--glycine ligase [Candidatus Auribacterota bacterium]